MHRTTPLPPSLHRPSSGSFFLHLTPLLPQITKRIVRGIHREREARSLSRTRKHRWLTASAGAHSPAMAAADSLFHQDDAALRAQWRASAVAENVASISFGGEAPDMAKRIVEAWIASPGHNANMFNPIWTNTGCAAYVDGDRVWATCLYALFP